MSKVKILGIVLGMLFLGGSASWACDGTDPAALPVPAAEIRAPGPQAVPAVLTPDVLGTVRFVDAPPIIPSNRCEALCLAEFRRCQVICRDVICFIPCEFLLNVCVTGCAGSA